MSSLGKNDERGLVSFMITIVMMVVISLIVAGFTQVANRNRRQALDRQLSTQAFYAAESGVNDVITKIKTAQNAGLPIPSQTSCNGSDYQPVTINSEPLVRYTCVFVSSIVPDITVPPTSQSTSVVPINPVDASGNPVNATELTFKWSVAVGGNTNPGTCSLLGQHPATGANSCGYATLRVDLLQNSGQNSAAALAGGTSTFYMQPVRSGAAAYTFGDSVGRNFTTTKANRVAASCVAATGQCTATILLNGSTSSQSYTAHVSTLYRETQGLIVDGKSGATNVWFKDAQAIIDVTGKAQDVLRRIKVRVPLHKLGGNNVPLGGIQSGATVCKRFTAYPGYYSNQCP